MTNKNRLTFFFFVSFSFSNLFFSKFRGKENVVGVDLCLRNNDSIAFVMPYIPHERFHDYFDKLTVKELQDYIRNLLIALKHVHNFNVIHRDVKPSNFLHDRHNKKYLLVDFGLAQELEPEINNVNNRHQTLITTNNNNKANGESVECDKNVAAAATNEQMSNEPMETNDVCKSMSEMLNDSNHKQHRIRPLDSDETENKCSSIDLMNPAKRQRTSIDTNITANVIQNANNNNNNHNINTSTSQHSTSYIPSQFKTPLKQMNEISMKKKVSNELTSPLSADIKSAILGYSIHSKLQTNGTLLQPQRITPPNHKYKLNNRINSNNTNIKCFCYGRPMVCNICLVKREIQATRAGTPGYRPTEVLLKYPNQTTAVDIWAAGVILISILSGCYPFFKSTDDFTALAEIITVFGDEMVKMTAFELGRHVCISHKKRPLNLRKLCIRLRNRGSNNNMQTIQSMDISTNSMEYCDNCEQMDINCLCQHTNFNMDFSNDIYPDSVYDLLYKLLAINPFKRITANDALQHPFFKEIY